MKHHNPTHRTTRDRFTLLAFIALVALLGLSLMGQSNAAFYAGGDQYDRQTIWIVIGGVVFFGCAVADLRLVERSSYLFYGFCLLLLAITLVAGTSANNSQRWIRLGAINIQASEFTKLAVILALARYLHGRRERVPGGPDPQMGSYDMKSLLKPLLLVCAPLPFILMQPDLGTSLMILFVAGTMLLVEGIKRRTVLVGLLTILVVVPVAWESGFIRPYQKDRVFKLWNLDWEKVDKDTGKVVKSRTTQVEQAVWAIGSGGFTGQGIRQGSKARLSKLPEIHTDFIVAMTAEEIGFVGMTLMLFLFWWLVIWGLRAAHDARSRFCKLIATGISALIAWQVFINIGMVSGMLPVVGLPLPVMSYGGSAMLMLMAGLGLMFNVVRRRGRL